MDRDRLFHGVEEEEEDEAAYVDSFFLPGGILDPEDDDDTNDGATGGTGTQVALFDFRTPSSPWISLESVISKESAPKTDPTPHWINAPAIAFAIQPELPVAMPNTAPESSLSLHPLPTSQRTLVEPPPGLNVDPACKIPAPPGFDSTIAAPPASPAAIANSYEPDSSLILETTSNHHTNSSNHQPHVHGVCGNNESSSRKKQRANEQANSNATCLSKGKAEISAGSGPRSPHLMKDDELLCSTSSFSVAVDSKTGKHGSVKTMDHEELAKRDVVDAIEPPLIIQATQRDECKEWNIPSKRRVRTRVSGSTTERKNVARSRNLVVKENDTVNRQNGTLINKQSQEQEHIRVLRERDKTDENKQENTMPALRGVTKIHQSGAGLSAGKDQCAEMPAETRSQDSRIKIDSGISIESLIDCWVSWSLSVFRLVMELCRLIGNTRRSFGHRTQGLIQCIQAFQITSWKLIRFILEVCCGLCKYAVVGGWQHSYFALYGVVLFLPHICDVIIVVYKLPHYIPHLLSCSMLLYVTRSRAREKDDLASIVSMVLLKGFRASLLGSLIVEGFLFENVWCMRWNLSERIILGFMLSVLRDGLVLSPVAWMSWAIQVFLSLVCPWHNAVMMLLAFSSLRYSLFLQSNDLLRDKRTHR